jgi:hypothetical protein
MYRHKGLPWWPCSSTTSTTRYRDGTQRRRGARRRTSSTVWPRREPPAATEGEGGIDADRGFGLDGAGRLAHLSLAGGVLARGGGVGGGAGAPSVAPPPPPGASLGGPVQPRTGQAPSALAPAAHRLCPAGAGAGAGAPLGSEFRTWAGRRRVPGGACSPKRLLSPVHCALCIVHTHHHHGPPRPADQRPASGQRLTPPSKHTGPGWWAICMGNRSPHLRVLGVRQVPIFATSNFQGHIPQAGQRAGRTRTRANFRVSDLAVVS